MPSLQERRWRFFLFPTIYLSQGLVAGFATTALVNHFTAAGMSVAEIGRHVAIVGLPWLLQPILWGPLVDGARARAMGRYRFWLVLAIGGAQTSLAGLLLLGDAPGLGVISLILLAHSTFASLMDTTTDRMIVETVPTADLGRMTASTRAGFATGGAIGTALFGELLARGGFTIALGTLLATTTALLCMCLVVRENAQDKLLSARASSAPRGRLSFQGLAGRIAEVGGQLTSRRIATLLLFCFLVDFVLALVQVPLAARMVGEHLWEPATLSRHQALFAFVGGTLVTGLAGIAVDRLGAPRAIAIWLVASAIAFAMLGLVAYGSSAPTASLFILGVTIVFTPIVYVLFIPYAVELVRDAPSPATLFQIVMATLNMGDIAGAATAGAVGAILPIGGVLLVAAALMLCFRVCWKPTSCGACGPTC